MDSRHADYLSTHHRRTEWHGRSEGNRRLIVGFSFTGSELPGWTLLRVQREQRRTPVEIKSVWHRGDPTRELLSINLWEAGSVADAHDQVLEVLANIQSGTVERRESGDGIGDVLFALQGVGVMTMVLFARVNVVVLVRNAERRLVNVEPVARELDGLLLRLSERESTQ